MIRTTLAAAAVAAGLALVAPAADATTAPHADVWASQACIPSGYPHAGHHVVLWGVVNQSTTLSATVSGSTRVPSELNGSADPMGGTAAYDVLRSTTRRFVTERATVTFADGSTRVVKARVHLTSTCS